MGDAEVFATLVTVVGATIGAWLLHRFARRYALHARAVAAGFAPITLLFLLSLLMAITTSGNGWAEVESWIARMTYAELLVTLSWLLLGWIVALLTSRILERRSKRVAELEPDTFT